MQTRRIELAGRDVTYRVRHSRRRTIGLRIDADGLTITLPQRTPAIEADRVARDRAGWILPRLEKWSARARPEFTGAEGQTIGYLGRELDVVIEPHARARTLVSVEGDALRVSVDERLEPSLRDATIFRAVKRWRSDTALAHYTPRIAHYARALGLPAPQVKVRAQESRWGSCSSDGVIRMNTRLIAFPEGEIDYVCAHEACHLIEMNHSQRFYALLDAIMPDHKARRRSMRERTPPGFAF
ncbi:M48 family metallopeptidase [Glycocaulis abyssi]|uniref:M48 family metallopeptidase n=1 Tax=Glycocaulis abyssi TaxID=1433403 RepID=A0ABV9NBQ4_9PROT